METRRKAGQFWIEDQLPRWPTSEMPTGAHIDHREANILVFIWHNGDVEGRRGVRAVRGIDNPRRIRRKLPPGASLGSDLWRSFVQQWRKCLFRWTNNSALRMKHLFRIA